MKAILLAIALGFLNTVEAINKAQQAVVQGLKAKLQAKEETMNKSYQQVRLENGEINDHAIKLIPRDGIATIIVSDPGSEQWAEYEDWLAAGNTPEPADPAPEPAPETQPGEKEAAE